MNLIYLFIVCLLSCGEWASAALSDESRNALAHLFGVEWRNAGEMLPRLAANDAQQREFEEAIDQVLHTIECPHRSRVFACDELGNVIKLVLVSSSNSETS